MFPSRSCISTTHNSFISSHGRLSLETSGYESLHDGKFTESKTQLTIFTFHGATPHFLLKVTTLSTLNANFYEQLLLLHAFNIHSCYIYSIIR